MGGRTRAWRSSCGTARSSISCACRIPRARRCCRAAQDPGRVRNRAFFDKMYGDCRRGRSRRRSCGWSGCRARGATSSASPRSTASIVRWHGLARAGCSCRPTTRNICTAGRDLYVPVCRRYRPDQHARLGRGDRHQSRLLGLLAVAPVRRWPPCLHNRIPPEIVAVFERHGFIWGGRWVHFDTMHFEYRPELLPRAHTQPAQ